MVKRLNKLGPQIQSRQAVLLQPGEMFFSFGGCLSDSFLLEGIE